MLYWAYGSNLNPVQMRRRAPHAKRVGPLTLDDGKLVFRGVADVTSWEGGLVPGGVWRISSSDEQSLDQAEGVRHKLYRKRYLRLKVKGVSEDCLYYQMVTKRGIMPPSEAYLWSISAGYDYFGLDLALLNQALEESWSDKKVTEQLRERHVRRGRPQLATEIR